MSKEQENLDLERYASFLMLFREDLINIWSDKPISKTLVAMIDNFLCEAEDETL
jgi:hypothetical protein